MMDDNVDNNDNKIINSNNNKSLHCSWQSVFRMTIGGNKGEYGDRIATVFFKSEKGVVISSAVNDNNNFVREFKDELKEGDWNNIVISQEFEGLKLMYKVRMKILSSKHKTIKSYNRILLYKKK